eukprot:2257621-Pyramimonas_sp.AAC.1
MAPFRYRPTKPPDLLTGLPETIPSDPPFADLKISSCVQDQHGVLAADSLLRHHLHPALCAACCLFDGISLLRSASALVASLGDPRPTDPANCHEHINVRTQINVEPEEVDEKAVDAELEKKMKSTYKLVRLKPKLRTH